MGGPGELLELTVGAVAAGGACVARTDAGQVVFVRHALPGERVRAVVTAATTGFLRADAVEVLAADADRVAAPCPYAGPGGCGGCDWQHVALARQRALKADLVAEQLRRLVGVQLRPAVEAVPGDDGGLGWRTRVQFAVDGAGRPGLHRHRSAELVAVERCLIAAPEVDRVGAHRLPWPGARAVEVVTSGEQAVVAVTGRPAPVPDVPAGLVVGGRPVRVPHGVVHRVLGRDFAVAAGGFWQVHPGAATVLAEAVLTALAPRPGERVVDLYAGAGLFAALLAERVGAAGAVLAVEGDRRAAADCARNTRDLPWVRVRTAAVDAALVSRLGPADLVVLDPPRAGAGTATTAALAATRPRRLAYVACAPAAFARDLAVLRGAGWRLTGLRAFDLYPMTEHVELVGVLEPPGAGS